MDDIQRALFDDAVAFRDANTHEAATYEELSAALVDAGGFVTGGWCGSPECEAKVKADTKAHDPVPAVGGRGPGRAVRGLRPARHRARDLGRRLLISTRAPADLGLHRGEQVADVIAAAEALSGGTGAVADPVDLLARSREDPQESSDRASDLRRSISRWELAAASDRIPQQPRSRLRLGP